MLCLLLAIGTSGFSQTRKDRTRISDTTKTAVREAMKKKKKEKGGKLDELNLSTEQKQKARELKKNDDAAKDAIKNDANMTEDQKKAKLKELRKARQEKLKTMLTPEQKEKLKTISKP